MLRNKGFQMIVGTIVIAGIIIAWLMLGGEAPSNDPVQKETTGANAKVRNTTLAREVDGKKVWEFTVEEVEQIKSSGEAVLKGIKGKIYREDGSVLEVVAGGGRVKNEAKDFELNNKVVVVLSSSGKLTAESVRWQQTEDIITASGNVRLLKDDTLATGDKAITSSAFEKLKLEGNAEVQKGGDYSE
ncbi:MAG: LPS export ABC transporter periplasmic protein LptC [Acidaminococcaceae bacterium]|nr:LPS export ABC transporter periplasmic protein LptC [Acidaminococcaceae bacterium]